MKLSTRYIILCLFTLSSAFGRAESVGHEFDAMWRKNPQELVISNSNHTGTTDFCTYTCGNDALFSAQYELTASNLAVFLEETNAQVETTVISGLDSLVIHYYPTNAAKEMYVYIKEEGGEWQSATVEGKSKGVSTVKLPNAGDYQVRIRRKNASNKVYVWKLEYFYVDLSGCPNCFLYRPE